MANKELKFGSNLVIVEYAKKDRLGNQIDTTYAKKSGDTFTGTLTVPSINISSDKYQLKLGTPAYPGMKPSSVSWKTTGISLSQDGDSGGGEASGIYLDGDKIVMWSPFDSPGFIIYDEDNGGVRFQVDGNGNIYENGTSLSSKYLPLAGSKDVTDVVGFKGGISVHPLGKSIGSSKIYGTNDCTVKILTDLGIYVFPAIASPIEVNVATETYVDNAIGTALTTSV